MTTLDAWRNMREVCIVGVGLHKFGRGKGLGSMGREAILAAFDEAGAEFNDIQAGFSGRTYGITGTGQNILGEVGQTGILIDNVEKASASSSAAVRLATWAIGAGLYDVCLCVGVESMGSIFMFTDESKPGSAMLGMPVMDAPDTTFRQLMGIDVVPAQYALWARRHMHDYGTTREMFARVTVKNRKNGVLNPYAEYQTPLTLEEILNSEMIADPLTFHQCARASDGASAMVLCAKEVAHRFRGKPITIAGWASGTPQHGSVRFGMDISEGMVARLAAECYERAGVDPQDVDVAQVHDAFSSGEILAIEECGICPAGEGGRFIWEGKADIGGQTPVNTDGGLEGRGNPQGATGIAQLAEIVRQLRGEAGPRQVPGNPKVGLTHSTGISAGCQIFILTK